MLLRTLVVKRNVGKGTPTKLFNKYYLRWTIFVPSTHLINKVNKRCRKVWHSYQIIIKKAVVWQNLKEDYHFQV
nr:MAG TPA: hypothetical protein [Bacteriophage sp.]